MERNSNVVGCWNACLTSGRLLATALMLAALAWVDTTDAADSAPIFRAANFGFAIQDGDAELTSAIGVGDNANPIVVTLRLGSIEPARLRIIRYKPAEAPKYPSLINQSLRLAVTLVVVNDSPLPWNGYDVELEQVYGEPSVYGDGLSFDQMQTFDRVRLGSDRFADTHWAPEPHDRIKFRRGAVNVGQRVRLAFAITDLSPTPVFYLRHEPKLATTLGPSPRRWASVIRGGND